jgi:hypothetical protein
MYDVSNEHTVYQKTLARFNGQIESLECGMVM